MKPNLFRHPMNPEILRKTSVVLGLIAALGSIDRAQVGAEEKQVDKSPRYRLIDLGTLGGPDSSPVFPARSLNNRGQLIAFSATAVPDPECFQGDCFVAHAILRQPNGHIVELPFPPRIDATNNNSLATDLTQDGLIGGFVENGLIDPLTDFPQLRPVIWGRNGSNATDLGTFGGNSGQVSQRNNRGFTVGVALNSVPENPDFASFMNFFIPAATRARAFVWESGALQDLGTLGGHDACAAAINNSGLIFGMSYVDSKPHDTTGLPTVHPFLWCHGQMQDLGTRGGTLSVAGSLNFGPFGKILNNCGQAIGTSTLPGDETWHAFLWDNGAITDLGVVSPCKDSTANSVNSRGEIVGGLGNCSDNRNDVAYFSAFVWKRGGEMVDLNTLITNPTDLHVDDASFINARGEIAGGALTSTGESRAVLLVPVADD